MTGGITGGAFAGIGALGAAAGKNIHSFSRLGKAIKATSKVSMALALGLNSFDLVAMGAGFFNPESPLARCNETLHLFKAYNTVQFGINVLAVFTVGASTTMKCFVAGTLVLTASGLVAIEKVRTGDRVTATDTETFEVAEKKVLETYVRETTELVHLTVNGGEIVTTADHPFYVKDHGFVNAGELCIGDKLFDVNGNVLTVENSVREITEMPVKVYNFQVEDFHTYHVGELGVLVHNADYPIIDGSGKLHDLPSKNELRKWSRDDLEAFFYELEDSIGQRNDMNNKLGADFGHTQRVEKEREILECIKKLLGW